MVYAYSDIDFGGKVDVSCGTVPRSSATRSEWRMPQPYCGVLLDWG
jgi:hypothetical protein